MEFFATKEKTSLQQQQDQQLTPSTSSSFNEQSPLLLPGVNDAIIDAILDLEEQQQQQNQRDGIQDDDLLTDWEIVRFEWRQLAKLSAPMMIAGLLDVLPDMMLGVMTGHLSVANSTKYIAALSLSSLFHAFIVDGIVNGFASAMDTLCSQAFGGSRLKELWMFTQAGVVLYLMCLPLMSIVLLSGSSTLRMLGQDPAIAAITGEMLVAYAVAVPFAMAYATMKSALQAQNIGVPFMVASLFAWIVSGASTYLLAYHTSLGIMGIAMSIPISWIVKALVLAPMLLKNRVFVDAWPGWRLKEAFTLIPLISKLGFSSFFMVTSQMIAYICMSLFAGMLPNASVMITANSIFASLLNLSALCLTAFCVATAIRIGNSLGAGQARRAALLSRVVLFSSLTISLVGMMVMGCVATLYASSFTFDESATHKASELIHKLLPLVPWTGVMFGLQGIFRACGKQMLCAQFNFAFLSATGVPLGLLFAVHYDKGLVGLWTGHAVGLFLFVAAGIFWLHRLSWEKMTSDAKRNTSL